MCEPLIPGIADHLKVSNECSVLFPGGGRGGEDSNIDHAAAGVMK